MRIITHVFAAAGTVDYNIPGRYLRLIQTSGPIDIAPLFAGAEVSSDKAIGVEAGFATRPPSGFDGFRLTSASAQTIRIAVTNGSGEYDRLTGDVNVISVPTTPVTGPLTDAQLRATAVPVTGPLTDAQLRATPPEIREVLRPGTNYSNEAQTAANNTAYTVLAPGSNPNGAIVWTAHAACSNSGNPPVIALLDHTATPTVITDGRMLAMTESGAGYSTGSLFGAMFLVRPVFVPAGRGIYFFHRYADTLGWRSALLSVL